MKKKEKRKWLSMKESLYNKLRKQAEKNNRKMIGELEHLLERS